MSQYYKNITNSNVNIKCDELLESLPSFCHGYYISTSGYTKPLTQLAYLQRLDFFFRWLHDYNPYFAKKSLKDYAIDDMGLLKKADFEEFLHHIDVYGAMLLDEIHEYKQLGKVISPSKTSTRNSYLSALNSLFNYFIDEEYLIGNPVSRIRHRKEDKKIIIGLDDYQKDQMMSVIDEGSEYMSSREDSYREKVRIRDRTIILVAMRTGIRVSELVALDLDDIDDRNNRFKVIRKRGKEEYVYFDDEVKQALADCIADRKRFAPADNERALFLSGRGAKSGSRLSVRSVEILVKKYSKLGTPEIGAKMTPHKLRSTCASDIIEKTGDIHYAQTVLGHESITTTTHYIKDNEKLKEERRNLLMGK